MDLAPPRRENKYFHSESGSSLSTDSLKDPLSLNTDFYIHWLWRTQTSQQIRHCLSALRETEVWFTLWNSKFWTSLPVRCPVIHDIICFKYSMFALVSCMFSGVDPLTFGQFVRWLIECAVSGLKSPAAMWELLSLHEHKASFHKSIIPVIVDPALWWVWCLVLLST